MKKMTIVIGLLLIAGTGFSAIVTFDHSWGQHPLFNVVSSRWDGMELIFTMDRMAIDEGLVDGVLMRSFGVPAIFLAEPGYPNLTGANRYVAIPQGARVEVEIIGSRTEVMAGVEVMPAPNIPLGTDDSPLKYIKNAEIYAKNAYWPSSPVIVSAPFQIRGVDVVVVGVVPFQYNPVTKELVVYKDIRFRLRYVGGNGHFGVDRLRSRFWEPILQGHLLNYSVLPKIDFYGPERRGLRDNVEYIIIVPDDPVFIAWGDTLCAWRKLQGISSEVFTLTEVGGSTTTAIENFLNNAYNTWSPAPAAFLLLSDYSPSGEVYGIPSPVWNSYCVSDNIYADVNADDLPDMHYGRICAQSQTHLSTIINKMLTYERNPYTAANFYANPLVACGWQDDRWFQLAAEVCRGYLINELGKNPARQYQNTGNPIVGGPWCTRAGTTPVVAYWNALGYVTMTNQHDAAWWSNGSAAGINAAINSGAFFIQHRDHGATNGWSEPSYTTPDISGLTNTMYTFVNSTNCLTGQYDYSSEVFAERFHRIQYGALGLNAASEVSYSFVNDTYIWGMWDCMWPDFDPAYPAKDMIGYGNLRPCFAQTYGKIYLYDMWFPDSIAGVGGYRVYTNHLFHHHGDCFMTLYSIVPLTLSVSHPPTLMAGATSFPVSANDSSVIALTVNGEIIGVAEGTGSAVNITIPAQVPGTVMKVTITKANYYRYVADVTVVSSAYPYVTITTNIINDSGGDGVINPGESVNWGVYGKNVGQGTAQQVYGLLSESNTYVTVTNDSAWFGNIAQNDSALSNPYYVFNVASNTPNNTPVNFTLQFHDFNDSIWTSYKTLTVYAPVLTYQSNQVTGGNGNGILDPGETANIIVTIKNEGGAIANSVTSRLREASTYITVSDSSGNFGNINPGNTATNNGDPYTVTASAATPIGTAVPFDVEVRSGIYCDTLTFSLNVGKMMPSDTGYYYTYWSHGPYAQCPVYSWYAIDTTQSVHVGTPLDFGDDQTSTVTLPFTFQYYGVNYTQVSICSNGWLALGSTTSTDYTNSGIPNTDGPPAMVAGVWDDLYPGTAGEPACLYYYNDATNHRFVVEWFKVPHISYPLTQETFEIILYNEAYYPTPTNDGEIIVQYQNAMKETDNTCGIENSAQTVGIQYFLEGAYHTLGVPITDTFALKYTTVKPSLIGIEEENALAALVNKELLAVCPSVGAGRFNIAYSIKPGASDISLRIYDASGRLVKTFNDLANGPFCQVTWNGDDDAGRSVSTGIYFVRLNMDNVKVVDKAVLLR